MAIFEALVVNTAITELNLSSEEEGKEKEKEMKNE